MTSATKYVALDVHQATTLASVRAETGRVIARDHPPHRGAGRGGVLPGHTGCRARRLRGRNPGAVAPRPPPSGSPTGGGL